jgi:hypothetical protein
MTNTKHIFKNYKLYEPVIEHHLIYKASKEPNRFAYNHDVSLAYFNGRFYAAWNAHHNHIEGEAGQVNVLSTSEDFKKWTEPVPFLSEQANNPIIADRGVMWQPNLLNYNDRELWCFWCICDPVAKSRELPLSGTYFSRLGSGPGAKWDNILLCDRHVIDGKKVIGFPSQNPFLCSDGRVVVPLTFIHSFEKDGLVDDRYDLRWNVCAYTDDSGKSWQYSNPLSMVGDAHCQWEPFFYEQHDGKIRCVMRNMSMGTPDCIKWQLTCVSDDTARDKPVSFSSEPVFSHIETANSRCQVIKLKSGRFCMFHHDCFLMNGKGTWEWDPHHSYDSRYNISLFMSNTGADDYVASIPVSRRNIVSAYPQGLEHNGSIYLAYTIGNSSQCRSIEACKISPAPAEGQNYIWPRMKDKVKMDVEYNKGQRHVFRANEDYLPEAVKLSTVDENECLLFKGGNSAGVEIGAADFCKEEKLLVDFTFKLIKPAEFGLVVLLSFGDINPIRLAVPSNRANMLYAYSSGQWQPVSEVKCKDWVDVSVVFGRDKFDVYVDSKSVKTFDNPVNSPNQRLYLGQGYESDYLPEDTEAEFQIMLDSIKTQVISESNL